MLFFIIKNVFRIVLMLFFLWFTGLAIFVFSIWNMKPYDGNAEGVVVLTGGDARVEAGLKLLADNHAKRLLISGVHHDVKINDLIVLNHQDKKLVSRIDLGFAAQDTWGNAGETAAWVEKYKIQSIIIVTAHYHMPRALLHMGAQLPDVALYPYPVMPKLFGEAQWYKNETARRLVIDDYNKFLLTYPQILFLKQK